MSGTGAGSGRTSPGMYRRVASTIVPVKEERISVLRNSSNEAYAALKSTESERLLEPWPKIPKRNALHELPKDTINEIRKVALSRLFTLFWPRILVRRLRAAQRVLTNSRLPNEITSIVTPQRLREAFPWLSKSSDLFLSRLQSHFQKRSYKHGETLSFMNTPLGAMEVILVIEGAVLVEGNKLTAPVTLNAFEALERSPVPSTIRAIGVVDTVWISANDFLQELAEAPPALSHDAYSSSILHRKEVCRGQAVPVDAITRSPLFRAWPVDDQLLAVAKFTPVCLAEGEETTNLRHCVIYVQSGRLIPVDPVPSMTVIPTDAEPGDFVGDISLFTAKQNPVLYRADYNTNIFVMTRADLKRLIAKPQLFTMAKSLVVMAQQEAILHNADNLSLVKRALKHMPFLGHRLNQYEHEKLLKCIRPVVYMPQDVICSTSEYCDKMVLVVRGRAAIRSDNPNQIVVGEPVGYTMMVEHKWKWLVVAESMVETIVIERGDLENFLSGMKDRGQRLLKAIKRDTMVLMNPSSHTLAEFAGVSGTVSHLKTTPLYEADVQRVNRGGGDAFTPRPPSVVPKDVVDIISPTRNMPQKTLQGKSDVFYSVSSRSCRLAFRSKLLEPAQKKSTPGNASPDERNSPEADRDGVDANGPKRLQRRRVRLRLNEERDHAHRVENIIQAHHSKVDGLWQRSSKAAKAAFHRMYPPMRLHGGSFARSPSFASQSSLLTPRASRASSTSRSRASSVSAQSSDSVLGGTRSAALENLINTAPDTFNETVNSLAATFTVEIQLPTMGPKSGEEDTFATSILQD